MEPTPTVKPGDLLASKYRVERVLGQGGMGMVVAARHEQLGFHVALKFMLPAALGDDAMKERFLREARAAGSLRSEHVARVTDFGTLETGAPYIVMEFLEGADLGDMLARVGKLRVHEAAEYVLQACKAMQEAHAQGIIHRDLKPQNLFLTKRPDGTPLVKVLDFGISKLTNTDGSLSMTSSQSMMGSPLYMAPEQIRSAKNVDLRADVYSLGCILYQLTTGVTPVQAETLGELFENVFTKTITPLRDRDPSIPAEFDALVMRCLASNPNARLGSVTELAEGLAQFVDARRSMASVPVVDTVATPAVSQGGSTTLGRAASVSEREEGTAPQGRGASWIFAGAAVVAAAALVGGVIAMKSHAPPQAGQAAVSVGSSAGSGLAVAAPPVGVPVPSSAVSEIPSASSSAPALALSASHVGVAEASAKTAPRAKSSPPAPRTVGSPAPVAKSSHPPSDPFGSPD